MTDSKHDKLADFARDEYEPLMRGLAAVRQAVFAGQQSMAADHVRVWHDRLVQHLAWEERSVLPAVRAQSGGCDQAVGHEESHRALLGDVADLSDLLRPGRGPAWVSGALAKLSDIEHRLIQHRDREIYGVCAVIDAALPAATVHRIERELLEW